jgi:membrane-associated phospholipid phosphatase
VLAPFFPSRPNLHAQPFFILAAVFALFCCFSAGEQTPFGCHVSYLRDWIPLALALVAFREMELFMPANYNAALASGWIRWDQIVLVNWRGRAIIESLGPVLPLYFELCYLLVYGVGAYCVLIIWVQESRKKIDVFNVLYLLGTLTAYGMFPFFPSQPPRIAYPLLASPGFTSWVRRLNLDLLNAATIHTGVFPSAHVSSAFAATWAMFLLLRGRKGFAWGMLVYALSVSIATVYGRYHYIADIVAGFAVSLVPAVVALFIRFGRSMHIPALVSANGHHSSAD